MSIDVIGAVAFLAMFVESFVEYVFGSIKEVKRFLPYLAMVGGVVLAVLLGVDMIGPFLVTFGTKAHPIVTTIMTGLVIGRGSEFAHDILMKMK